ncbi:cytochrome P450 [Pilatotrama ljubarskyi]|nr:cytochrome P450 [Pilatotrama ljubarskyi]
MLPLLLAVTGFLGWFLYRFLRPASPLAKVPGPRVGSWLSGHVSKMSARDAFGFFRMLDNVYGAIAKVKGPFSKDWLYVYDPTAIYSILSKDQASWDELEWFTQGNNYFLGPGLIGVAGETHRKQRKMLHPAFSTKHVAEMTLTFYEVTDKLVAALMKRVDDGPKVIDVLSWTGRTALELIAQAGIGHSFDPLVDDNTPDTFAAAVKQFVPLFFVPETMMYHQLITVLRKMGLPSVARWCVNYSPLRTIRELRDVSNTLHDKSSEVIRQKKAALQDGELGTGKDIISILLKANSAASDRDKLPDDELVAQVSTLLFAATDTTSNALARALHVLCEHPVAQSKLRQEILAARDGSDLTYDALHALPYLDAVCKETLRWSVTTPFLLRIAYRDTTLPFSQPIRGTDGSSIESVFIPKGTIAVMSLSAYNRNKALWGEDADEWKPERWLVPLPRAVEETPNPGVYAHLMSFLGGGRSCIGFKFSLLEMKVVLTLLLANFTFELSPDKPVVWNHSGVIYPSLGKSSSKPEMWLKVDKYRGATQATG